MNIKWRDIIIFCILILFILFVRVTNQNKTMETIQNIFDEMIVNYCKALKNSKCTEILSDSYYRISMKYKYLGENIDSVLELIPYMHSGPTKDSPLYIYFTISDDAGNEAKVNFVYYQEVNKLYIWGECGSLSWAELEAYRDYLLNDVIIGSYLKNSKSAFSSKNLGEFELIDYLMPYEYCGMPEYYGKTGNHAVKTQRNEQGITYTTWLDEDGLLCMQQEIAREERTTSGHILGEIPIMLIEEIYSKNIDGTRFVVKRNEEPCRLSDLIEIDSDFIEWMKNSGRANGNLQRISPDRTTGCLDTQKMLKKCPAKEIEAALEQCEFYIEPGYLHIRFPYWDYTARKPAFIKNGNDLWRGWLTIRTDDIEGFLKVEKW